LRFVPPADGSTAMALHLMRGGELGILGFCRRERWGMEYMVVLGFAALTQSLSPLGVCVISPFGGRCEDFSSAVLPFAREGMLLL